MNKPTPTELRIIADTVDLIDRYATAIRRCTLYTAYVPQVPRTILDRLHAAATDMFLALQALPPRLESAVDAALTAESARTLADFKVSKGPLHLGARAAAVYAVRMAG